VIDRLVVSLDLEVETDRVLPWIRFLAQAADVEVDLLTVSSPGMDPFPDRAELAERAKALGLDQEPLLTVEHSNDVPAALVSHLEAVPSAVLCMASHARSALRALVVGSVTTAVLERTPRPVFLVGRASSAAPLIDQLVVCVGADPESVAVADLADEWLTTFPMPALVAAVGPADDRSLLTDGVEAVAADLGGRGHEAAVHLIDATDPGRALGAFLGEAPGRMAATVTHARRGLSRIAHGSVTGDLLRSTTAPVLVRHATTTSS
jgi:nucleotide-binding universal stress UspA family protein